MRRRMNRLAAETSPYLIQHADNPVDWYPWGDEALGRARAEDKPILLSIGYAACHWCHVMEHESFEDSETAKLMNELFVNMKVDREERPDLDSIYMDAVVALTGHGGGPMFPNAPTLEFLLRRGELGLVERTLDGMALGGMYDLVGGGFHRYSVDAAWLVPHFEKMLYDNAQLVPAFLHGWLVTGKERYREVAEETLEYMLRELRLPAGGFASAQDADTDGVEGRTFTWTPDEGVPEELLHPFEHGRFIV